ncbi:MAG: peptidyl-prolyl cis-trans isomerase [Alphaproteobacteria bacterium]|nr:peptidyl-prolyl cis-trans isomerase [Alphaproteobacteria bacterium]
MAMKILRDSASGGLGKFILFGFLVLAVGGLIMTDVGGFFRGGVSNSDVAAIGKEKISIQSFDRTLRMTLSQIGLSPQDAYKAGYVNQLLASEIRSSLLSQAAKKQGIYVDKTRITKQIKTIIAPYVEEGQSEKDILNRILLNQGMSEKDFIESIGQDTRNSLLTAGLSNGFAEISEDIARDLYRHKMEQRDIEYVVFMNNEIKNISVPTDKQLEGLYLSTKENYAQPEMRRFKLVTIKDDALKKTLEISKEEIRNIYDDNIDLYTTNESKTLDMALLDTEEHAKFIIFTLNKGKSLKDSVKEITKKTTGYIGEKDFEKEDLVENIKDKVLTATKIGTIIGPVQSPLGWYVVVVKKITPEKIKNFEDVKKDIKEELMETLLIDQQYALANNVDDLLASGSSLEDVAEQIDLNIQMLSAVNRYGQTMDNKDGLDKHKEIKTTILEVGFELEEDETSPVFEAANGRFMAIYLEKLTSKTYTPYNNEIKKELSSRWINDQKRVSNRIKTMKYLADLNENKQTLENLAKTHKKTLYTKTNIKREDDPKGILTMRSVMNLFEADINRTILIDIDGGVAIANIKNFKWPEEITTKSTGFEELKRDISAKTQREALMMYLEKIQNQYNAKTNQTLLERVYGSETQNY